MKKIVGKNDVFRQHILSEIAIGIYRPGGQLPGERELSETYQVSRSTVRRALGELEEMGLLLRRPPVGTFVLEEALSRLGLRCPTQPKLRSVLVMPTAQASNPVMQQLFTTLRGRLPDEVELSVTLSDTCSGAFSGEKTDIAFLFGNYADEDLKQAAASVRHSVLIGRWHREMNFVTSDDYAGGRLMAEAAIRAGHRRLALIGPSGTGADCEFSLRAKGIAEVCHEHGASLQMHRLSMEEAMNLTASVYFALENFLRVDPRLSLILALRDREALAVMDCCGRRGLSVPDDLSVIGCDDHCFAEAITPPLTTMRSTAVEEGVRLAGFAEAVLHSGPEERVIIREAITPLLIERSTVKTIGLQEVKK